MPLPSTRGNRRSQRARRRIFVALGLAALACFAAPSAFAQQPVPAGGPYLRPGTWDLAFAVNLDKSFNNGAVSFFQLGTRVGYFLSPHFEIGGVLGVEYVDIGIGATGTSLTIAPWVRVYPGHFDRVSPFFELDAGGGAFITSTDGGFLGNSNTNTTGGFALLAGVGTHIFVHRHVAATALLAFTDFINNNADRQAIVLQIGLSLFL